MNRRKGKSLPLRILSSIAALMLTGSIIFIVVSGFNLYVTTLLASGFLGLAVPSVVAGGSFIEMLAAFFEALFDGIMEIIAGIFDALTSIFG